MFPSRLAPTCNPRRRRGAWLAICILGLLFFPASGWCWGSAVHRIINRNAVANLPPDFQGFSQWADELETLSTAADERKCCVAGEGIRHYIDIDDYSEFFSGVFPHAYDQALQEFGRSRLESNGIGPWAVEESFEHLVTFFAAKDWPNAVATAADIGHYAADLHQPLHLTVNFDGQLTGQDGIHSRFESRMTGQHLAQFTPLPGAAAVFDDPIGRVFQWIDTTYPGVDLIMAADRNARAEAGGSTSSQTYYDALWNELGQDTWSWAGMASKDIAALWYTAWVRAGSPALPGSIPVETLTWGGIKSRYREQR